jgi:XTP/dITP diphosphohydrolase
MSKPTIYFVTTNDFKYQSAKQVLLDSSFLLERLDVNTPEIQADDNLSVAEYSAKWAANTYNLPVITEDVGIYIDELNGFPGPYLSQVEKQIGAAGFLKLLEDKSSRAAYWEYVVSFCNPGDDPVSFTATQHGEIALDKSGTVGWDMGKIFIPTGQVMTISALLDEQRYVRNNSHYTDLKKYLNSFYA